jgi:membrane protein implicated in regulation of membrane protease activity
VRPIARRHINMPPQLRTGTAALIGRTAIVTERIVNDEALGKVRLDGEVWSARAYDDDKVLEPGTRVHVMEIRGATALVDD